MITSLQAKVVKNEVVGRSTKVSKIKDVCELLGHRHLLIVSPVENHSVNCMGKIERVTTFCEKQYPKKKGLLRGIISPLGNESVICEFGDNVRLKVECTGAHSQFCKSPKESCSSLREVYARTLSPLRSSVSLGNLFCLFGE